jgi:hypothetical protein
MLLSPSDPSNACLLEASSPGRPAAREAVRAALACLALLGALLAGCASDGGRCRGRACTAPCAEAGACGGDAGPPPSPPCTLRCGAAGACCGPADDCVEGRCVPACEGVRCGELCCGADEICGEGGCAPAAGCRADGDCPAGQRCAPESARCVLLGAAASRGAGVPGEPAWLDLVFETPPRDGAGAPVRHAVAAPGRAFRAACAPAHGTGPDAALFGAPLA